VTPHKADPVFLDELADAVLTVRWEDIFDFSSEGQRDFCIGSTRRYQMWIANRGGGKSYALANKALFLALQSGGEVLEDGTIVPTQGLLLGRTGKEVEKKIGRYFVEHCRTFKRATGLDPIKSWSASDKMYTMNNGCQVYLDSYGSPQVLAEVRGWSAVFALADEVAHARVSTDELWDACSYAVREGKNPQFGLTTSPAGDRGIVAKFLRAWEREDPEFALWSTTIHECGHIDDAEIARRRSGATPESWAQEALGMVLRPSHTVYSRFRETLDGKPRHVVPFGTPDPTNYWVIGIDWGISNAYYCFISVDLDGVWTVFYEHKARDVSQVEFRNALASDIDRWSRILRRQPDLIGSDRAIKDDNAWLRSKYGSVCQFGCRTCISQQEQERARGIKLVQWMLDPLDQPPRLRLADTLPRGRSGDDQGLRDALPAYTWQLRRVDGELVTSDYAARNTPESHPVDAVRYAVVVSRKFGELHGGAPLRSTIDDDIRLPEAA